MHPERDVRQVAATRNILSIQVYGSRENKQAKEQQQTPEEPQFTTKKEVCGICHNA